jgi:hypothetical protein
MSSTGHAIRTRVANADTSHVSSPARRLPWISLDVLRPAAAWRLMSQLQVASLITTEGALQDLMDGSGVEAHFCRSSGRSTAVPQSSNPDVTSWAGCSTGACCIDWHQAPSSEHLRPQLRPLGTLSLEPFHPDRAVGLDSKPAGRPSSSQGIHSGAQACAPVSTGLEAYPGTDEQRDVQKPVAEIHALSQARCEALQAAERLACHSDPIVCLTSTSGTNGEERVVALGAAALLHRMRWQQHHFPLHPDDVAAVTTASVFVDSVMAQWLPIASGALLASSPRW